MVKAPMQKSADVLREATDINKSAIKQGQIYKFIEPPRFFGIAAGIHPHLVARFGAAIVKVLSLIVHLKSRNVLVARGSELLCDGVCIYRLAALNFGHTFAA